MGNFLVDFFHRLCYRAFQFIRRNILVAGGQSEIKKTDRSASIRLLPKWQQPVKCKPAERLRFGCFPVPLGRGGRQSLSSITMHHHLKIHRVVDALGNPSNFFYPSSNLWKGWSRCLIVDRKKTEKSVGITMKYCIKHIMWSIFFAKLKQCQTQRILIKYQ